MNGVAMSQENLPNFSKQANDRGIVTQSLLTVHGETLIFNYSPPTNSISACVKDSSGHSIEIHAENLPSELKSIKSKEIFASFFKNTSATVVKLCNNKLKLHISRKLLGGGNCGSGCSDQYNSIYSSRTEPERFRSSHNHCNNPAQSFSSCGVTLSNNHNEISQYCKTQPPYSDLPNIDAIIAAILSGLAIAGGLSLTIVSGGLKPPGLSFGTSVLISCGIKGMCAAIDGAKNKNFKWGNFMQDVVIHAGLTLITFAKSTIMNVVGVALLAKKLGNTSIRLIGAVAKALASENIRNGAYVLVNEIQGLPVNVIELEFKDLRSFSERGIAGYLVVRAKKVARYMFKGFNSPLGKVLRNSGVSSPVIKMPNFQENGFIKVVKCSLADLSEVVGCRIYKNVGEKNIFGFTDEEFQDFIFDKGVKVAEFTDKAVRVVKEFPYEQTYNEIKQVGKKFIESDIGKKVVVIGAIALTSILLANEVCAGDKKRRRDRDSRS